MEFLGLRNIAPEVKKHLDRFTGDWDLHKKGSVNLKTGQ